MTINHDELRSYLKIDKFALDDELVQQPSLFEKVSDAHIEAAADRDALKEALATVDAELASKIRKKFGSSKYTEGQVKEYVQTASEHVKATDEYLEAKKLADKINVLKDAFHQRSYMLRGLVQLHTSNYFEATSVRSTPDQDRLIYETRRARLAAGRK